jgi:sensor histidine kinase YesM
VVWWLFLGIIYGFLYLGESLSVFGISLVESFLFLPAHMFLSYGIIYGTISKFIMKDRYWAAFVVTIVLIIATAFISTFINMTAIKAFRAWMHFPYHSNTLYFTLMAGLRGALTVAGFAVAIKLVKQWYLKRIEAEQLEKEKLRAELQSLQGQLHPHFIFNTLNSIYSLALKQSSHTPDAILQLSQLMRYMLTECQGAVIDLEKEIRIIRNYIDLEKNRFGERLDINMNIEGDIKPVKIAPLLLLPFIENSFKHGTHEVLERAWISLDLSVANDTLRYKIINGKAGGPLSIQDSSHVGLKNVKKRLQLLYPDAHHLRITEDDDLFVVSLTIQLHKIKLPVADV